MFAASEAVPFIKTGDLPTWELAKAYVDAGRGCRVILPLYRIKQELKTSSILANLYVNLSWRFSVLRLFKAEIDGVIYYLIDNEYYFKRSGLYGYLTNGEDLHSFQRRYSIA